MSIWQPSYLIQLILTLKSEIPTKSIQLQVEFDTKRSALLNYTTVPGNDMAIQFWNILEFNQMHF